MNFIENSIGELSELVQLIDVLHQKMLAPLRDPRKAPLGKSSTCCSRALSEVKSQLDEATARIRQTGSVIRKHLYGEKRDD